MTDPRSMTSSIEVAVDPATAFEVFTEELDCWWIQGPINFFDTARAYYMRMEPGVGGRIVEVYDEKTGDGLELARITVWEPGERVAWTSSLDDVEIDVRFERTAGGTEVQVQATIPEGRSGQGRNGVGAHDPGLADRLDPQARPGPPRAAAPGAARRRRPLREARSRRALATRRLRLRAREQRPRGRARRPEPHLDRVPRRQRLDHPLGTRIRLPRGRLRRRTRRSSTSTTSTPTSHTPRRTAPRSSRTSTSKASAPTKPPIPKATTGPSPRPVRSCARR